MSSLSIDCSSTDHVEPATAVDLLAATCREADTLGPVPACRRIFYPAARFSFLDINTGGVGLGCGNIILCYSKHGHLINVSPEHLKCLPRLQQMRKTLRQPLHVDLRVASKTQKIQSYDWSK